MHSDGSPPPWRSCSSAGPARRRYNKYKFAQAPRSRAWKTPASTGEADGAVDPRRPLGRRGEDLAVEHFGRLGFRLLDRNFHSRSAEIDLILFDGQTLVFAEIKTRTTRDGSARARESSDERKLGWPGIRQFKRSREAAFSWLREQGNSRPRASAMRFDVVRVRLDAQQRLVSLDHIQAAWEGVW